MAEQQIYLILKASHRVAMRFGWVSSTTGITYCGICLRAPVAAEIGAECCVCGARVAQLVDVRAKRDAWRRAWKEAAEASPSVHRPFCFSSTS